VDSQNRVRATVTVRVSVRFRVSVWVRVSMTVQILSVQVKDDMQRFFGC